MRKQDLEKDAHMVPLGRFILNFGWQEEPGLAAGLACARDRAEEKGITLLPGVLWQGQGPSSNCRDAQ